MTIDDAKVRIERKTYTNSSASSVLYPLGNIKVQVAAGETLVFFTSERVSDPFSRARTRRKWLKSAAPYMIILAIVVVAAFLVRMIALKDASG